MKWIKLKNRSKKARENNKRVTIGYVYFIPREKRIDPSISSEIKIVSLKNNAEYEETISIERSDNLIFLADIIVEKHNELESQKVLKNCRLLLYLHQIDKKFEKPNKNRKRV